jgi:hypothetical protein
VESTNYDRPPAKRLAVGIFQLMQAEHRAFVKAAAVTTDGTP